MDQLATKAVDPDTRQECVSKPSLLRLCSLQPLHKFSVISSQRRHQVDLWVDRYRPQRFVDLAGDERVNRETLAWVKEWDQCVFGIRKRNLKRKREDESPAEQGGRMDQWGRPREKVQFEFIT